MGATAHPAGRLQHAPVTPAGIDHQVLSGALAMVKAAVGRSMTLPVLGGVRITRTDVAATIEATDLEMGIRIDIAGGADEGETLILPYKVAVQALSNLSGRVEITHTESVETTPAREEDCTDCEGLGAFKEVDDDYVPAKDGTDKCYDCKGTGKVTIPAVVSPGKARLVAGSRAYEFRTLPTEDFPASLHVEGEATAVAGAKQLREALPDVAKLASADEARPILTGVLFDWNTELGALELVTTDSYRLGVASVGPVVYRGDTPKVVIPARAAVALADLLYGQRDVEIVVGDGRLTVRFGPLTFTTRLIEGEFPNWRQLLPEDPGEQFTISSAALLDAIKAVGTLAQQGTPVRLELAGLENRLTAGTQDVGEASETLRGVWGGEPLTLGFNPGYLASCIRFVEDGDVHLRARDGLKPAILEARPGRKALLMPVRIK